MSGMLTAFGAACICSAMALDHYIRLKMRSIGHKTVFRLGGFFNYNEYLAAKRQHGWSALPVYLMYVMLLGGLVCVAAGIATSAKG